MDIQPQETKPISDDQELAKVLAGVSRDADNNLNFEETPITPAPMPPELAPIPTPTAEPVIEAVEPTIDFNPPVDDVAPVNNDSNNDSNNLETIKKDALNELRPLVDKLDLAPEEKFDIYLLLLRSTDDKTLIAPAHAIARNIADESRRAQALLDIIKEIDYLSNPPQTIE